MYLLYPSCPKTGSHTPKNEKVVWPAISYKTLTIAFSKPHSWFLEVLLYLIINGHSNSVAQPNHKNTNLGFTPKTNSNEIQLYYTEILSLC